MSQEAAASRAGISTRALRDIERDRARRPRVHTLGSLAGIGAFGTDQVLRRPPPESPRGGRPLRRSGAAPGCSTSRCRPP
ncbi:helix-turn-helix domain-containing protein [Streptomyces globisporus]|uniref:helix-turn-helix domain-containing protein n=1 Tax=Streptomyces globisporus TaxID=1908 RepID=UPI0009965700|nr:helix-turn-helix transcriptional regulator [Streptomyces globisporus]